MAQVTGVWMIQMSHHVQIATTNLQADLCLQEKTMMVHVVEPFRKIDICQIATGKRLGSD